MWFSTILVNYEMSHPALFPWSEADWISEVAQGWRLRNPEGKDEATRLAGNGHSEGRTVPGAGNPTLAALEKIGSPFGLKVDFLPPERWRLR